LLEHRRRLSHGPCLLKLEKPQDASEDERHAAALPLSLTLTLTLLRVTFSRIPRLAWVLRLLHSVLKKKVKYE
jgi:hypothetical protein